MPDSPLNFPHSRGSTPARHIRGISRAQRRAKFAARPSALEELERRELLSAAVYAVTTTADSGSGSLRDAITQANANTGLWQNTIQFQISSTGVQTITLLSALPTVAGPIIIDGFTEGGYAGAPLIQINGASAGPVADGIDLVGGDSTVRGLAIENFAGAGLRITGLGNDTVQSSYIGLDAITHLAAGNGEGIVVQAGGNFIGTAGDGNVISGNHLAGVHIAGIVGGPSLSGNSISSNLIGTDPAGRSAIGNNDGIVLDNVSRTMVSANTLSGNISAGLRINSTAGAGNVLAANKIGVSVDAAGGTLALGNGNSGIELINSVGVLVGGAGANGNVVSANNNAIIISGGSGNTVAGNFIGTDTSATGTTDVNGASLGNQGNGVDLQNGTFGNVIGGTATSARNIIAGSFGNGVLIETGGSAANLIAGNYIGTDYNGVTSLSGFGNGVQTNSSGATISGNLISGNFGDGIHLNAPATVQGNWIGSASDGITAIANFGDGIYIASSGNIIGGAGRGNTIADNLNNGVNVFTGTLNAIQGNSIFGNTKLGIDLGSDGPTANAAAPRSGANNLQNYPVLTKATITGTSVTVTGTLSGSLPSATFTIDLYANTAADNAGAVEGRTYLGSTTVTTDLTGSGTFTATLGSFPGGQTYITATATDTVSNTSEFSAATVATVGMPQAMTSPRGELRSGRTTAASDGPSPEAPTSGLITLPACTS